MQEVDGRPMGADGECLNVTWSNASKPPGTELFVEFLPLSIDRKTVRSMFSPIGTVADVDFVRDQPCGAKWKCVFLSFFQAEDAARAIDELDGHVVEGTPVRVRWSNRSRPRGVDVRLHKLDQDVDRRILLKIFKRFDGIRRIEIAYSRLTGASLGCGYITFGTREQADSAAWAFGGRLLSRGDWGIDLPKEVIERELSRDGNNSTFTTPFRVDSEEPQSNRDVLRPLGQYASSELTSFEPSCAISTSVKPRAILTISPEMTQGFEGTAAVVGPTTDGALCIRNRHAANSDHIEKWQRTTSSEVSALLRTAQMLLTVEQQKQSKVVRDLLTDRLIDVPVSSPEGAPDEAASEDLISFDESQQSLVSALAEPPNASFNTGSVRSVDGGRLINVRFFSAPESGKQEKVCRILLDDAYEPIDPNNNLNTAVMHKATLVVRDLAELRTSTDKLTKAGIDAFICEDQSLCGGHSWRPNQCISVHVAEPPLADNIRYSQHIHVIFLRPSDDVVATLELLRTHKTDVTMVSVLYDKGSPFESARMASFLEMLSMDALDTN